MNPTALLALSKFKRHKFLTSAKPLNYLNKLQK